MKLLGNLSQIALMLVAALGVTPSVRAQSLVSNPGLCQWSEFAPRGADFYVSKTLLRRMFSPTHGQCSIVTSPQGERSVELQLSAHLPEENEAPAGEYATAVEFAERGSKDTELTTGWIRCQNTLRLLAGRSLPDAELKADLRVDLDKASPDFPPLTVARQCSGRFLRSCTVGVFSSRDASSCALDKSRPLEETLKQRGIPVLLNSTAIKDHALDLARKTAAARARQAEEERKQALRDVAQAVEKKAAAEARMNGSSATGTGEQLNPFAAPNPRNPQKKEKPIYCRVPILGDKACQIDTELTPVPKAAGSGAGAGGSTGR